MRSQPDSDKRNPGSAFPWRASEGPILNSFLDARTLPAGTVIQTDLAIIGGGAAGITLALALAHTPIRMLMLESGGLAFDDSTQALYSGEEAGVHYLKLDGSRLRYFGGSTNHWGGWCRPLDKSDFEKREWLPYSGWPFGREALEPYIPRAQQLVEAGEPIYDDAKRLAADAPLNLGKGGLYTTYFQFSKTRGGVLPTHFGKRYGDDLRRIPNLDLYLHANVTALELAPDAGSLDRLEVATLSGNHFTVKPRYTVLAAGGIENARILLVSNDVAPRGVGNANDLVGRFFADHCIPREVATLVTFDGNMPAYYTATQSAGGVHFRAALSPTEDFKQQSSVLGSLTTVENEVALDDLAKAAVAAAANALGVDAGSARAFSLGTGFELAPDPDRRLTLTGERDALGLQRLKLDMRVSNSDFARYRSTLRELGRQLLAARTGLLRIQHRTRDGWLSVVDWGNHHMGTTRMHDDPKHGVVNANSQVHGVPNLYIAGSSVFPTYGSSNPTMNLVALTLRLADHLKMVMT